MSRLLAIASNTFREAIRDRVLYSILFFAAGVLILSVTVSELTIGDGEKVVRSIAQGAIRLFSSGIALFLGVGLVFKELERKTIYTIASKPIPRWLFLLGKYAGLMGVLAVELLLLGALYVLVISLQQEFPPASVFVSWFMLYLELGLLTAWALLFSSYSSPTTATFFSLSVYVIGHLADDIALFGESATSESVQTLSEILYWVLPNFELFNASEMAVHGMAIPSAHLLGALAYGIGYSAVVLAIAARVLSTRDFK